ncbi:MAG: GMC oxidoreductase [Rhodococcus sp. (in: high G+C Gram-positive bacteria)]|uniref:GMC oxidoreductase n=1 Tax=Rhodococcus sp. TaxID=1831 RepID=UPI003BB20CD3
MPDDRGWDLANVSGFRPGISQNRPVSRGHARITSPDPMPQYIIRFNHLSDQKDVRTVLAGMKLAERIAERRLVTVMSVVEFVVFGVSSPRTVLHLLAPITPKHLRDRFPSRF